MAAPKPTEAKTDAKSLRALLGQARGRLNVAQYQETVKNALFCVELSNVNADFITYFYNRERKGVDYRWCCYTNWAKESPVNDRWKSIYDVTVTPQASNSVCQLTIHCLPDRPIMLHLKKSGAVVPKVILSNKECTLYKVYVEIDSSAPLPRITGVWIIGTHKGQLVQEQVQITDKMLERFSPQNFLSLGF